MTWLIKVTGNPLAPAWYWTAAAVVGIAGMLLLRESAPRRVPEVEPLLVQVSESR